MFALFRFDPFELRAVDIAISNDMLCCLDALRRGRADLHRLVPDGDRRVRAVIDRWGLRWPDSAGATRCERHRWIRRRIQRARMVERRR